jgi:hypothetical protein
MDPSQERSLAETRRLYVELGERMNLTRLRWLEGKIARELGQLEEAEAALEEARGTFLEHGIGIDAALVSLDLALSMRCAGRRSYRSSRRGRCIQTRSRRFCCSSKPPTPSGSTARSSIRSPPVSSARR